MHRYFPIWIRLWITGGALVFIGAGLPFSMVMRFVEPTFLLLGLAALASIIGTFLSLYATSLYMQTHRRRPPRW